ncbi:MAG: hypothetical protein ABSG96_14430 [Terracidiphilus sp.]|jgi:hypothetical protein
MSERLVDRIPFAKIVAVLAITFGVSLGLCGLTFVLSSSAGSSGGIMGLGILELIAMALSAAGLVVTLIVWVLLAAVGSFGQKVSTPQKLFDDKDETKHDKDL